jgi:hypothetical protein
MATIATGVLHDVGNLLNSINVSCDLLSAVSRNPVFGHLERFQNHLNEHRDDFPEFVANSPDDEGFWQGVDRYLQSHTPYSVSHGVCPGCYDQLMAPLTEKRSD